MYSLEDEKSDLQGDLDILSRHLGGRGAFPTQHDIRAIIAPILRKWICDNGIKTIHDEYRTQSTYTVPNFKGYVYECQNNGLDTWLMTLPVIDDLYVDVEYIQDKSIKKRCVLGDTEYNFNAFKNQKVAYLNGEFINRDECIRFLANKMGGAHTQKQSKHEKKESLVKFVSLFVVAIDYGSRQVHAFDQSGEERLHELQRRGYATYSAMHLVVLDTARRFNDGMRAYISNAK